MKKSRSRLDEVGSVPAVGRKITGLEAIDREVNENQYCSIIGRHVYGVSQ